MRKTFAGSIGCLIGFAVLLFTAQPALAMGPDLAHAHVPFPFFVSNHLLPAGDYAISTSPLDSDVILVRNRKTNQGVYVMTDEGSTSAEMPGSQSLRFDELGDAHILTNVDLSGLARQVTLTHRMILKDVERADRSEVNKPRA
jgi:hypothetical protein